jgi:alpha-tubulin suppressor-like RCC1 family protein
MCWGAGTVVEPNGGVCQANWGQSIVDPNLGKCTSISAGGFHTCAITELGTVKCWGKNVDGQCNLLLVPCVQISCGLNFSAGRFIEDEYETFPYWNASNQRSTPALASYPGIQLVVFGQLVCLDTFSHSHLWNSLMVEVYRQKCQEYVT